MPEFSFESIQLLFIFFRHLYTKFYTNIMYWLETQNFFGQYFHSFYHSTCTEVTLSANSTN